MFCKCSKYVSALGCWYHVEVKTAKMPEAGTDSRVLIRIGNGGKLIDLDMRGRDDFEQGR
jgi:hypothetical protein